jgi:hypothetical protein
VKPRKMKRPRPPKGCRAIEKTYSIIISLVVLCGCDTCYLVLRGELGLNEFKNGVLRMIVGLGGRK